MNINISNESTFEYNPFLCEILQKLWKIYIKYITSTEKKEKSYYKKYLEFIIKNNLKIFKKVSFEEIISKCKSSAIFNEYSFFCWWFARFICETIDKYSITPKQKLIKTFLKNEDNNNEIYDKYKKNLENKDNIEKEYNKKEYNKKEMYKNYVFLYKKLYENIVNTLQDFFNILFILKDNGDLTLSKEGSEILEFIKYLKKEKIPVSEMYNLLDIIEKENKKLNKYKELNKALNIQNKKLVEELNYTKSELSRYKKEIQEIMDRSDI